MLTFISYIIKLLVKLLLVEQLTQKNEELIEEKQRLIKEKEELERDKQQLLQQNFDLIQKYVALNHKKDELIQELLRSQQPKSAKPNNHSPSGIGFKKSGAGMNPTRHPKQSGLDINQDFNTEDLNVIEQIIQDFDRTDTLSI